MIVNNIVHLRNLYKLDPCIHAVSNIVSIDAVLCSLVLEYQVAANDTTWVAKTVNLREKCKIEELMVTRRSVLVMCNMLLRMKAKLLG